MSLSDTEAGGVPSPSPSPSSAPASAPAQAPVSDSLPSGMDDVLTNQDSLSQLLHMYERGDSAEFMTMVESIITRPNSLFDLASLSQGTITPLSRDPCGVYAEVVGDDSAHRQRYPHKYSPHKFATFSEYRNSSEMNWLWYPDADDTKTTVTSEAAVAMRADHCQCDPQATAVHHDDDSSSDEQVVNAAASAMYHARGPEGPGRTRTMESVIRHVVHPTPIPSMVLIPISKANQFKCAHGYSKSDVSKIKLLAGPAVVGDVKEPISLIAPRSSSALGSYLFYGRQLAYAHKKVTSIVPNSLDNDYFYDDPIVLPYRYATRLGDDLKDMLVECQHESCDYTVSREALTGADSKRIAELSERLKVEDQQAHDAKKMQAKSDNADKDEKGPSTGAAAAAASTSTADYTTSQRKRKTVMHSLSAIHRKIRDAAPDWRLYLDVPPQMNKAVIALVGQSLAAYSPVAVESPKYEAEPLLMTLFALQSFDGYGDMINRETSARYLAAAAQYGEPIACAALSLCRARGRGCSANDVRSHAYAQRSLPILSAILKLHGALQGPKCNVSHEFVTTVSQHRREHPDGLFCSSFDHTQVTDEHRTQLGIPLDFPLHLYSNLRGRRFADFLYFVGWFKYHGLGTELAEQDGLHLFQLAALGFGLQKAMNQLGMCIENGCPNIGLKPDAKRAVMLYRRAASCRYIPGLYNYGLCFLDKPGTGCVQQEDRKSAFKCFKAASKRGYTTATYAMGWCYMNGTYVKQSHERAAKHCERAATTLFKQSISQLAHMYMYGKGKPVSTRNPHWLHRFAMLCGYKAGFCNLGFCIQNGCAARRNARKAVALAMRCVSEGCSTGVYFLAHYYERGCGVPKSIGRARFYRSRPLRESLLLGTLAPRTGTEPSALYRSLVRNRIFDSNVFGIVFDFLGGGFKGLKSNEVSDDDTDTSDNDEKQAEVDRDERNNAAGADSDTMMHVEDQQDDHDSETTGHADDDTKQEQVSATVDDNSDAIADKENTVEDYDPLLVAGAFAGLVASDQTLTPDPASISFDSLLATSSSQISHLSDSDDDGEDDDDDVDDPDGDDDSDSDSDSRSDSDSGSGSGSGSGDDVSDDDGW
jgi:TPR repeat protein